MANGIYLVNYVGKGGDFGTATVTFMNGEIFGVDVGGVEYTGNYQEQNNIVIGEITLNVPAGTALVTGAPMSSQAYSLKFPFSIPANLNEKQVVQIQVQLPTGPVNANVKKIKNLAA